MSPKSWTPSDPASTKPFHLNRSIQNTGDLRQELQWQMCTHSNFNLPTTKKVATESWRENHLRLELDAMHAHQPMYVDTCESLPCVKPSPFFLTPSSLSHPLHHFHLHLLHLISLIDFQWQSYSWVAQVKAPRVSSQKKVLQPPKS